MSPTFRFWTKPAWALGVIHAHVAFRAGMIQILPESVHPIVFLLEFQMFVFKVGEVLFKCDTVSKPTELDISGFFPIQLTK